MFENGFMPANVTQCQEVMQFLVTVRRMAGAGTDPFREAKNQCCWVAVAADCTVMHIESGAAS